MPPVAEATPTCRVVFLGVLEVSTNIILDGIYDGPGLEALARFVFRHLERDTTVLDIGANIGNHAVCFSEHFSRVVAFEPNPRVAAVLRANVMGLGTVDVVPIGLSDRPGVLNFEICEHNLGGSRVTDGPGDTTIEVKTLDSLARDLVLQKVSFVKIDIEEHEDRVLAGAAGFLAAHRPILALEGFCAKHPDKDQHVSTLLTDCGSRHL